MSKKCQQQELGALVNRVSAGYFAMQIRYDRRGGSERSVFG
jgi:hypothetical protein